LARDDWTGLESDDWLIYAGWADLILAMDEIITRESGYSRQGEQGREKMEKQGRRVEKERGKRKMRREKEEKIERW
jgi:hypothetical protein